MRLVFLDTVGLIAAWDAADQWHAPASRVFEELLRTGAILFTTDLVLAECGNAASRKPYRRALVLLREQLLAQRRVVTSDREEIEGAWKTYATQRPGAPGIVDLTSFLAMRSAAATDVFTNDVHFKSAGFNALF